MAVDVRTRGVYQFGTWNQTANGGLERLLHLDALDGALLKMKPEQPETMNLDFLGDFRARAGAHCRRTG